MRTFIIAALMLWLAPLGRAEPAESFEAKRAKDAEAIARYLALGARGEKLPRSFAVGLDWGAPKFADLKAVCQALVAADFAALVTAPRDLKKNTPTDAPCREVAVAVEGHGVYVAECFCEVPFADEAVTQRFRQLHETLGKLARPITPEEQKRKETVNALRRYLDVGAAGQAVPDSFEVRIETDAIGRSVGLCEYWVFTPKTIQRLAYVKQDQKSILKPVEIFQTNGLQAVCTALNQGGFLPLASVGEWICGRGSPGPFFSGTPFIGGQRLIRVTVEGQSLALGRNCWRATNEDDSEPEQQFADLYNALRALAPSPAQAIGAAIASGATGGEVPASLEVVIETFGSKTSKKRGAGRDGIISEAWRFRPNSLELFNCNVVDKTVPLADLKAVCQALQAAGFSDLAAAPRGQRFNGRLDFDGSPCDYGWRYVRVSVDGQSLFLGEGTSWPVFADTRNNQTVRALYQTLRQLAVAGQNAK